jgi:KamA family protein
MIKFKSYNQVNWENIPQISKLTNEQQEVIKVIGAVLPFKVNNYVLDHMINWDNIPQDPIFQLTFPQYGMLDDEDYKIVRDALKHNGNNAVTDEIIIRIRKSLNPHPSLQKELNTPYYENEPLAGMQHKYSQTLLVFPKQSQTCHSYCTFCFRWAQFIGDKVLKFATHEIVEYLNYVANHKEIKDILITGGDPLVAKTTVLASYIEPLLNNPKFDHIENIRIGTRALTFWPHRFLTDEDAGDLLRLFEKVVKSGKQLALMAHHNHYCELEPTPTLEAIKKIQVTGAVIRGQGPMLKHINNSADILEKLWSNQTRLGIIPYYLFVERDTGAQRYFELPIVKVWEIYREALSRVSGLARTVRGPSMTITAGKLGISGVTTIQDKKYFVLSFLQGRDPDFVNRPFLAEYDEKATFFHTLKPAFGEKEFFFEKDNKLLEKKLLERWSKNNG